MPIPLALGRITLVSSLLLILAACGGASTSPVAVTTGPGPRATITPVAEATMLAPTSTLAPTFVPPTSRTELSEATLLAQSGRYEAAISMLRPLLLDYQNNPDPRYASDVGVIQEQLAGIYLVWGRETVELSNGDLRELSIAYDRLNDGVIIAPNAGPTRQNLVNERDLAGMVIEGARAFEQLTTSLAENSPPTAVRNDADEMVRILGQAYELRADYPGLQPLYPNALMTTAKLYEDAPGDSPDAQVSALRRAQELCRQAAATPQPPAEAAACVDRIATRINRLTATPTRVPPTPTRGPVPIQLSFAVINYNDNPSCVSVQIRGVATGGWSFVVDGINSLRGNFDNAGNARLCGLANYQEVTFTVFDNNGRPVSGGRGIPTKGSAIMGANRR